MNRPSARRSLRLVFVDVIERESGIETAAPAEIDAFAQAPAGLHARREPRQTADRRAASSRSYSSQVWPNLSALSRDGATGCSANRSTNKFARAFDDLGPLLLVKDRVKRGGKNVHPLHGRREAVKEFALRLEADDPVAARAQA